MAARGSARRATRVSRSATARPAAPRTCIRREAWPRNANGVPLTFLAQLSPRDFPRLPDADQPWGHRDELIRIFADIREEPYEPGLAFGLSAPAADLRRAATPEGPEGRPPTPYPEIVRELPEVAVTAEPVLTVPAVHPAIRDKDSHWMSPLSRTYDDLLDAVDPDRLGRHQVLGWPEDGHDDTLAIGPFFESDFGMNPPTTRSRRIGGCSCCCTTAPRGTAIRSPATTTTPS
jgi:hypothetical protein